MASDRRTGGRLEDHPDQPRAAFGRARRLDACCRTCLCSCALETPPESRSHHPSATSGIERSVPYGGPLTHIGAGARRRHASAPIWERSSSIVAVAMRQQQAPGREASALLSWTNGSSRPALGDARRGCPSTAPSTGYARPTATTNSAPKSSITAARPCTPTLWTIQGCSSDQHARQRTPSSVVYADYYD
jgi:hypothetical protein